MRKVFFNGRESVPYPVNYVCPCIVNVSHCFILSQLSYRRDTPVYSQILLPHRSTIWAITFSAPALPSRLRGCYFVYATVL